MIVFGGAIYIGSAIPASVENIANIDNQVFLLDFILNRRIQPLSKQIYISRAVEEYQVTFENRSDKIFAIERFKLNNDLILKLVDLSFDTSLFKDKSYREEIMSFGVEELIDVNSRTLFRLKEEEVVIISDEKLKEIEKKTIEVPLARVYDDGRTLYFEEVTELGDDNIRAKKNLLYKEKEFEFKPLNVNQNGDISLWFSRLNILLNNVELCTFKCPDHEITLAGFSQASIKDEKFKSIESKKNQSIEYKKNVLNRGIEVTYALPPYSYLKKITNSLKRIYSIAFITGAIYLWFLFKSIKKNINIQAYSSQFGIGERATVWTQQIGGSIKNKRNTIGKMTTRQTMNKTTHNQSSGDTYSQTGNFGIGHMSGGEIQSGAHVAGVINEAQQQDLAQAAADIQKLLEQLETSYPTDTTAGKMQIATEAISQIESNPALMARILSALKAGSVSAIEQFLNHPASSFVIAALDDWQATKGS